MKVQLNEIKEVEKIRIDFSRQKDLIDRECSNNLQSSKQMYLFPNIPLMQILRFLSIVYSYNSFIFQTQLIFIYTIEFLQINFQQQTFLYLSKKKPQKELIRVTKYLSQSIFSYNFNVQQLTVFNKTTVLLFFPQLIQPNLHSQRISMHTAIALEITSNDMLLQELQLIKQMKNEKTIFSKAKDNLNNVKAKIRINNTHLQSLKQKIMYQSSKISALQYTGATSQNQNINANLKRQNRSNDCVRRHHPLYESMLQKKDRKGSEANTMIEMYLSNIQSTHKKNKSQLYQFCKQSPKNQYQRKLTYYQQARSPHVQPQKQQKSFTLQHIHEPLKITTSTTTSSPTLLKTIEKIKSMVQAGQHSIKYSLSNRNREKTKQLKINDFQIIKYIQQGQFGSVYLAKHIATNFICAIKKIPKHIFGGDLRYINQLIREVKIQSFLQHPNIIRLYACFDDYDHVYLMMQYCSGGNLYTSLKKQIRFNEQKVRRYLKQICHAVQYMHDHDIIHRDIKPQNILMQYDLLKICDFGWSINSPLLRETHCGTPLYSSPQMIERKQYDSKVDIWNIGVMAYQFLYGKVPFQIRRQEDLIKIVQDDIYFSKHHPVSPAAKDFILKCMKKNPKQRQPVNKLLDHQFFHE